jgi:hypothetical protein
MRSKKEIAPQAKTVLRIEFMRTIARVFLVPVILLSGASAVTGTEPYNPGVFACGAPAQCRYQDAAAHRNTLMLIRKDALEQRQIDGGTLTPAHLAKFQNRLDAANRIYAHNRELRNSSNLRRSPSGGSR